MQMTSPIGVDLHVVDERVVLEDHRQARVGPEQRAPDVGPGAGQPPDGDRLTGDSPAIPISMSVAP